MDEAVVAVILIAGDELPTRATAFFNQVARVKVTGAPLPEVVECGEPAGGVVGVAAADDRVGAALRSGLLVEQAPCRVVGVAADEMALLAGGLLPEFVELMPGQGFAVEVDGLHPALRVVLVIDPAPVRGDGDDPVAE